MSTDIRSASEIAIECDGLDGESSALSHFSLSSRARAVDSLCVCVCMKDQETTRLLRLGINGATIILRAVTHRAAVYWVEVRTYVTTVSAGVLFRS